jgi:hypothetical protein
LQCPSAIKNWLYMVPTFSHVTEATHFVPVPLSDTGSIRTIVVDFDDTCTAQDTCSLLFEAAAGVAEARVRATEQMDVLKLQA